MFSILSCYFKVNLVYNIHINYIILVDLNNNIIDNYYFFIGVQIVSVVCLCYDLILLDRIHPLYNYSQN